MTVMDPAAAACDRIENGIWPRRLQGMTLGRDVVVDHGRVVPCDPTAAFADEAFRRAHIQPAGTVDERVAAELDRRARAAQPKPGELTVTPMDGDWQEPWHDPAVVEAERADRAAFALVEVHGSAEAAHAAWIAGVVRDCPWSRWVTAPRTASRSRRSPSGRARRASSTASAATSRRRWPEPSSSGPATTATTPSTRRSPPRSRRRCPTTAGPPSGGRVADRIERTGACQRCGRVAPLWLVHGLRTCPNCAHELEHFPP
jgi:hypothetical protein